jgi:maltose O-acetyltransferase
MKARLLYFFASIVRMIRGEVPTDILIKRGMKVGKNFSREGGGRIDTSYCFLIEIGNNVTLAPNVVLLAHDASLKQFLGLSKVGNVRIGNNVFIGANSVVLPNVTIGDNVIIGAGSIVSRDIPSNTIYAGNPARFIRSIDEIKAKNLELSKKRPLYDYSFNALTLSEEQKIQMKNDLKDGFGFYQCENYKQINNDL